LLKNGCLTKVKLLANSNSKTGNILLICISIRHIKSSETHTSQHISCMSVAEIKLKLANLSVETKLRNTDKLADLLSRTQQ
jgi:hypothetical protein